METKLYRMNEFIQPVDGHSLVVDASAGLSLGALPGLEQFSTAVLPLMKRIDGLVISPGQARRLTRRTRQEAAILARADWTNALRGPDFVLPPETTNLIPLLDAQDAQDLGASALVLHFLLGYEEDIEAACLRSTVQLALTGNLAGIPLISDILPTGSRVVLRAKAIELGVSYAIEGGASGVAIPWPGRASFMTIQIMLAGMPVWIKPTILDSTPTELGEALELGATGVWLDQSLFAYPQPERLLEEMYGLVHPALQVVQE